MTESDPTPEAILVQFEEGPGRLDAALVGLSESDLDLRIDADNWTIRETVHHIADGDDLWKTCLLAALGNPDGLFCLQWYWDKPQTEWSKSWKYAERPIGPMLDVLRANRTHVAELVRQTPGAREASIRIKTKSGEERISVGEMLEMQAGHLMGHIDDIEAIRAANRRSFRSMLAVAGLDQESIEASIAVVRRFEAYLRLPGITPTADTAWAFSRLLIQEGNNSRANYMALVRYCRFVRSDEAMVAFLELVDGGEVDDNLYRMVGERFGTDLRDELFAGIGLAPYGTPSPEKPAYLQPVIRRLERQIGTDASSDFLSACLRDLPEDYFLPEREMFAKSADIDDYLQQRKNAFMAELEACHRDNRLFFAQEITPDVLALVRDDPEMGGGRREGNVIYETKIPYMAQKYLSENEPRMKRYYACHCPWARDAIRRGDVELAKTFCQCSGGFHKKPLEAALGKPLRVEVLESALRGDMRCRFAIYLEAEAPGAD